MQDTTQTSPLHEFVMAAKARGASDEFLAALLTRQGWSADDVYTALSTYWEQTTGIPVPKRGSSTESSREAFLNLLAFLALGIWATALGTVLFQLVNVWVPDPVHTGYVPSVRTTITWSLAALSVAFPLYLLVTRTLVRESETNPGRLHTGVRKWLTYLALLITAGTVVGYLIGFTGFFLLGELSARFVVKSLVVLILCGGIFMYYMSTLPEGGKALRLFGHPPHRLFAWLSSAAVVATFVVGMAVAGKPADQRRLQADQRRVEDLRQIAQAVERWRSAARIQTKASGGNAADIDPGLPETLEALQNRQRLERIADPETNEPYRYEIVTPTTYNLCASFTAPTTEQSPGYRAYGPFWNHPQGNHCFLIDATTTMPW